MRSNIPSIQLSFKFNEGHLYSQIKSQPCPVTYIKKCVDDFDKLKIENEELKKELYMYQRMVELPAVSVPNDCCDIDGI